MGVVFSNKSEGTHFENEFASLLSDNGYWVHNFAQNASGQPADIIAVKNGRAYLIDCKLCKKDYFPLIRVEENQHLAMNKWKSCGNNTGWFALKLSDNSIWLISYYVMFDVLLDKGRLTKDIIMKIGMTIPEWIKICS